MARKARVRPAATAHLGWTKSLSPLGLSRIVLNPRPLGNSGAQGWNDKDKRRWAYMFRKAIERRSGGRSGAQAHLSIATGVNETLISRYTKGKHLPSLERAEAFAEALDSPGLVKTMRKIRTKQCPRCGKTFVDLGTGIRKWCELRGECYLAVDLERHREDGRKAKVRTYKTVDAALKRLAQRDRAILAECRSCEPSGICRNAKFTDRDCHFLEVTQFIKMDQPAEVDILQATGSVKGRGVGTGPRFTIIRRDTKGKALVKVPLT